MVDVIEVLEQRDDVAKTEYEQHRVDEGRVTIEMWHDTEGLQRIAERAMTGVALSQKGMENLAKEEALVTRETKVNTYTDLRALYPNVSEQLEDSEPSRKT